MKRLLIASLCLCLLVTCVSAGGMSTKKPINRVSAYEDPWEVSDAAPIKVQTIEKTIVKEIHRENPEPSQGLGIGFHSQIPEVSFDLGLIDLACGYTSIASDQSGIIRGGLKFYESEDKYTRMRVGASMFPGTQPEYGIYLQLEANLTSSISLSGFLYPARSGGQSNLSEAFVGACLKI